MTSDLTSRRYGLRAGQKLHSAADFERVRRVRERLSDALFVMQRMNNDAGEARLGMAVSIRAAGNAVKRNRLRRLIRESFRMHRGELPAVDVLVTARAPATAATSQQVFASLARHWLTLGAKP